MNDQVIIMHEVYYYGEPQYKRFTICKSEDVAWELMKANINASGRDLDVNEAKRSIDFGGAEGYWHYITIEKPQFSEDFWGKQN